jgi:metallo-beta-lactamase family protein
MRIRFFGGAGTVTGSKYLVEHEGRQLLVDCGLFQGLKELRLRNWDALPFPPADIDAVVLTHAHLDHSGFVPRLLKLGYRGTVRCSPGTLDLCRLLLPDSGHLLEEEAEYANRRGFSKHRPALPLYTEQDALDALARLKAHEFGTTFEPLPGVQVRLRRAGHIVGAASVHVAWGGHTLLFSGDLGRSNDLVMLPPEPPEAADTLVVESTYGDRLHDEGDALTQLAEVVNRTAARGGVVVMPAFAIGRAQTLLWALHRLQLERRIPRLPVYVNSPMATDATTLYRRHHADHRLDAAQCHAMCAGATFVNSVEASMQLNQLHHPAVIVSASGMATGGRVLHHLKAYAPDRRNTILFAGYQAPGTRGATIVGGADAVKIHGAYVPIRAEVANLDSLSAHADRDELLAWVAQMPRPPQRVFVTHGEPVAADALRHAIEERHGWPARAPDHGATFEL